MLFLLSAYPPLIRLNIVVKFYSVFDETEAVFRGQNNFIIAQI
jgi:hypothetical protein